jgi:hypothetical protein
MDYIVTGVLGSGKTLYSASFALGLALASRMPLYSNIRIYHPLYRPLLSVEQFANITRAVVLLDEAHRNLDARLWSQNKMIADAVLYNRKRMKHTVYTTPSYGNLEKRLRDICPVLIVCDRKANTPVIRVSWYDAQRPGPGGVLRRIKFQSLEDPQAAYGLYDTQEEAPILPLTLNPADGAAQTSSRKGRGLRGPGGNGVAGIPYSPQPP